MPGDLLDLNQYDPAYRTRILTTLMSNINSRFIQAFRPMEFTETKGKVPYLPQRATLGTGRHVKMAVNGRPQERQKELNSVEVGYDFKYTASASLTLQQLQGFQKLQNPEALIEFLLASCLMDIAVEVDLDGKELLTDTVANETQAATAVWTNNANARPLQDFEAACDKVGNPDTIWLGKDKARLLSRLDSFKAEVYHYAALDTTVSMSAVASTLMRLYEVENVVIDNNWYNTTNPAQTIGKARIFDGVVWVGYRNSIVAVENPNYKDSEVTFRKPEFDYYGWASAMYDFKRAEKAAGCVITGTTT